MVPTNKAGPFPSNQNQDRNVIIGSPSRHCKKIRVKTKSTVSKWWQLEFFLNVQTYLEKISILIFFRWVETTNEIFKWKVNSFRENVSATNSRPRW